MPLNITSRDDLQQTVDGRLIYPSQSYAHVNPNSVDYSLAHGVSTNTSGITPFNRMYATALQAEGFGRIISEALIMQKKILSFNYGGVRDQLEKLDDVYKVDPHKYSDIATKLQNILKLDDENFFNISSLSKEHISKSFSKSQMVKSYVDLYEQQSI